MSNAQFMANEIGSLLSGGKIMNPLVDEDDEFFGFRVERDGKEFNVWVQQDPEGNGPGWLAIEAN